MANFDFKLNNILSIQGQITLLSGLHIGAGDSGLHIGGTDSPVIKHPHTDQPYIPGSSIKGKLRSLLEWYTGVVGYTEGKPLSMGSYTKLPTGHEQAAQLLKLFGVSGSDKLTDEQLSHGFGLTRLSVADANLNSEYAKSIKDADMPFTEVKFENSINRLSGTADNPRNIERVPAGAMFDFAMHIKVFSCDQQAVLEDMILTGLKLIEADALGGSGSRGYGRVKFVLADAELQARLDAINPFASVA